MPVISTSFGVSAQDIFVGGVVGFGDLANPANTAFGRATGRLGLYMQQAAVATDVSNGTIGSIAQGMANTGPGEAELGLQPASQALSWFDVYWHTLFTNNGLRPAEINAIVDYAGTPGDATLADWNTYVDAARQFGVITVAPIFSPNGPSFPLDSFANDPYYAGIRAAALYGGGLTLDVPPHYYFTNTVAYQSFILQELYWAQQNNIRSTIIVSPNGDDSYFLQDLYKFAANLEGWGAVPSEWVVENYNPNDPNGVGNEQTPNTISNAALFLANFGETTQPSGSMTLDALPAALTPSVRNAPVTVTVNVHTQNITGSVYYSVLRANGEVESIGAQPVSLDAYGNATFAATLQASGDSVRVEDNPTSPDFVAYSTPVTIVQPASTITLSSPGTIQEAYPGAGVTFTENISTKNVTQHVDIEVITSSGTIETPWLGVGLTNGNAAITVYLASTGDYVRATDSETAPTVTVNTSPVTITDPVRIITLSNPGTHQESSPGAGVTVAEQITTTNVSGHVDIEVLTASGSVETPWKTVGLTNGQASTNVFFAQSGDFVRSTDSETHPDVTADSRPVTITDAATAGSPMLAALNVIRSGVLTTLDDARREASTSAAHDFARSSRYQPSFGGTAPVVPASQDHGGAMALFHLMTPTHPLILPN